MVADKHSTLAGGNETHIKDFLLPIEGGLHHKRVDELLQVPVLLGSQALRVVGGVQAAESLRAEPGTWRSLSCRKGYLHTGKR